jgi:hypothetical protein
MHTRTLLSSMLAAAAVACVFGGYDVVIPAGKLTLPSDGATSADRTTVFAVDQVDPAGLPNLRLASFDASSNLIAELHLAAPIVGMAAPASPGDSVWTLDQAGQIQQFDPELNVTGTLPTPDTGVQFFCDLGVIQNTVLLVTVDDDGRGTGARLHQWRGRGWESTWVEHANGDRVTKCAQVGGDPLLGQAVLLAEDSILVYQGATLAKEHAMFPLGEAYADIDA